MNSHYGDIIDAGNEETRKFRREQLLIRINSAMIPIMNDDLEKLVILAENWDNVVSVINTMRAMSKK